MQKRPLIASVTSPSVLRTPSLREELLKNTGLDYAFMGRKKHPELTTAQLIMGASEKQMLGNCYSSHTGWSSFLLTGDLSENP